MTRGTGARTGAPGEARLRLVIVASVALLLAGVVGLYLRQVHAQNHEAPADRPKPVSVEKARSATFRASRRYVGTLQPWAYARVGPQYVAAYVGAVLVRPGATVKAGQVLATLDCRSESAESKTISDRARALEQRQLAIAHESSRVEQLIAGGFASQNEVEQAAAKSRAEQAELESLRSSLTAKNLAVGDCILRAPFAGEVAERYVDAGAYVRPGGAVVSVVDRGTVRVVADAPESDFAVVAPGSEVAISVEATGGATRAPVSRRAPAADEATRTIHFEIDLPNERRELPVGTTARLVIEVGQPRPATRVPLRAATLRGNRASLFLVEGGVARRRQVAVLGESGADLFLDPALASGAAVVVEGRALLDDGDHVTAKEAAP